MLALNAHDFLPTVHADEETGFGAVLFFIGRIDEDGVGDLVQRDSDGNTHAGQSTEVGGIVINVKVLLFLTDVLNRRCDGNACRSECGEDGEETHINHIPGILVDLDIDVKLPTELLRNNHQLVQIHRSGTEKDSITENGIPLSLVKVLCDDVSTHFDGTLAEVGVRRSSKRNRNLNTVFGNRIVVDG